MVVFPKAKLNLGLLITGTRSDGFHEIETIYYPVSLCDALEVVALNGKPESDVLTVTGNTLPGKPEENLVIKAIRNLRDRDFIPFLKIHLHKIIPAGAGLGGGSSDAVSMMRMLNKILKLSIGPDEMKDIAANLGSDCPFFIDGLPAIGTGKGEILNPLKPFLNGHYALVLNPGISISTREAYENCEPSSPAFHLTELIARPIKEWRELITNDFEKTIFRKYPEIRDFKKALYDAGAFYSSMSGSGSGVYGIFREKPAVPADLKKFVIYNGKI